jgi:hypothetical protein
MLKWKVWEKYLGWDFLGFFCLKIFNLFKMVEEGADASWWMIFRWHAFLPTFHPILTHLSFPS